MSEVSYSKAAAENATEVWSFDFELREKILIMEVGPSVYAKFTVALVLSSFPHAIALDHIHLILWRWIFGSPVGFSVPQEKFVPRNDV